jgi:hypothetical protein
MPLKNQVLPHQFACFGGMIVVDRLVTISCVSHEYPDLNPWFKDVRMLYFSRCVRIMFAYYMRQ